MKPPAEVIAFYEQTPEESRLTSGPSLLEFERSKEILSRVLPPAPARIVDVGGAAGTYAAWLAGQGYEVHLVDAVARLVREASRRNATLARPIASLTVADARALPYAHGSANAVLLLGPLYHLPSREDRLEALREAFRVLVAPGIVVAAGISRYASALDGLARERGRDPAFVRIRDRDLVDGQHRNDTSHPEYFTTAYFHRPADLHAELEAAGFENVNVLGVEGPGWMLSEFDARWEDGVLRRDILDVARLLESEASIVGASAHLLAVGSKAREPVPAQ
jgi:SAM-dependent methyltransferase